MQKTPPMLKGLCFYKENRSFDLLLLEKKVIISHYLKRKGVGLNGKHEIVQADVKQRLPCTHKTQQQRTARHWKTTNKQSQAFNLND